MIIFTLVFIVVQVICLWCSRCPMCSYPVHPGDDARPAGVELLVLPEPHSWPGEVAWRWAGAHLHWDRMVDRQADCMLSWAWEVPSI